MTPPLKPLTDHSVPVTRIRFALELVNESRSLAKPFEPLLGGESVKFSVTVEILRRALSEHTLEFFTR
jgi:hypothetical protein